MTYCRKSLKSNRCLKSKYEDETSSMCIYNNQTNRCASTRKKAIKPVAAKQPFFFQTYGQQQQQQKIQPIIQQRQSQPSPQFPVFQPIRKQQMVQPMMPRVNKSMSVVNYYGFLVESNVKTYLNNLIMKKSAKKMRDLVTKYNFYIPLHQYPNDNDMKLYIIHDILELSSNDVRDRTKTNAITLNNIHFVIVNDNELLPLFSNKYKGLVKLGKYDIVFNHDKIREYIFELRKPYQQLF